MMMMMLLRTPPPPPDCFSCASTRVSYSFRGEQQQSFFTLNNSYYTVHNNRRKRSPTFARCRASLITTPDSFEVGRLLGSYGFININRYSLSLSRIASRFYPLYIFRIAPYYYEDIKEMDGSTTTTTSYWFLTDNSASIVWKHSIALI